MNWGYFHHGQPLGLTQLTRGEFIRGSCAALASAALGCGRRANYETYEQIFSDLQSMYPLGTSRKNGPKLVLFLEDVHIKRVSEENSKRLRQMNSRYGVNLVGLEGFAEPPEGEAQKKAFEEIKNLLYAREEDLADKELELSGGTPTFVPDFGSYSCFFKESNFNVVCLEDIDKIVRNILAAMAEDFYDQLLQCTQGYAPLEVDGKPLGVVYQLGKVQDYFKEDPEFPRFDVSRIEPVYTGTHTIRMLSSDTAEQAGLMDCLLQFKAWLQKNIIDPRTISASKKLMDEMDAKGAGIAAIIYGRGHSCDDFVYDDKQASVQNELQKRDFSYITISPARF